LEKGDLGGFENLQTERIYDRRYRGRNNPGRAAPGESGKFGLSPLKTRVTASFGIAQYQPDDTFETLVKRADEALYAAKAAGRNRVMTG
jgi:GGDEF domain-containing protein